MTTPRQTAWRNVYFHPEITENVLIESCRVGLAIPRITGRNFLGYRQARLLGTDWRFDLTVYCNRPEEVAVCIVTRDGQ